MNIYAGAYHKSLLDNENQRQIWTAHLRELKNLDLSFFRDKLKIPALIPIGNRLSLRGELVHTNEVTVSLGAGYFVKCTVKQAEIIMERRIRVAEEKLASLDKEKEYLEKHMLFSSENILKQSGQEIIEEYNEDKEKEWRKLHRENLRKHKLQERQAREKTNKSDNDLWDKLEELELKEELKQELEEEQNYNKLEKLKEFMNSNSTLLKNNEHPTDYQISNSRIDTDDTNLHVFDGLQDGSVNVSSEANVDSNFGISCAKATSSITNNEIMENISIGEKIKEIKKRLSVMQSQKITSCTTEEDVFKHLEQLEEQEMLEEELDRLETDTSDEECSIVEEPPIKPTKKSITFANELDSDCIEINFRHDDFIPQHKPFDIKQGIMKPSDIYDAFPENFQNKLTSSILKKTNHSDFEGEQENVQPNINQNSEILMRQHAHKSVKSIIGEVCEHRSENEDTKQVCSDRPISKFKAMRTKRS